MTRDATLPPDFIAALTDTLPEGGASVLGPPAARSPVHTVYGGAHLFRRDTAQKLGARAIEALDRYAPTPAAFAAALQSGEGAAGAVEAETSRMGPAGALDATAIYERVREKLAREPVEDYRIDFEDGYGLRSDAEEDQEALRVGEEVATGQAVGSLPPLVGLRIKPISRHLGRRGLRTLDLFVTTVVRASPERPPSPLIVTVPKVSHRAQVAAICEALSALEAGLGLAPQGVQVELMVESPEAVVSESGAIEPRALLAASAGRVRSIHFGPYDYAAACGIATAYQHASHPVCDLGRGLLQAAVAGSGIRLVDGPTHVVPVPVYRPAPTAALTAAQVEANRQAVHRGWRIHYRQVRRALAHGYYQGWDLHPAQLPTRYAAVYDFFRAGLDQAADRLREFLARATRGSQHGGLFDDAATAQGLLNYFRQGYECGALAAAEVTPAIGVPPPRLAEWSIAGVLDAQRARSPGSEPLGDASD